MSAERELELEAEIVRLNTRIFMLENTSTGQLVKMLDDAKERAARLKAKLSEVEMKWGRQSAELGILRQRVKALESQGRETMPVIPPPRNDQNPIAPKANKKPAPEMKFMRQWYPETFAP